MSYHWTILKKRFAGCVFWKMVRAVGLEPTRVERQILSLVRLPIPPRPHMALPVGLEPTTSWLTVKRSTDWAIGEYLQDRLN